MKLYRKVVCYYKSEAGITTFCQSRSTAEFIKDLWLVKGSNKVTVKIIKSKNPADINKANLHKLKFFEDDKLIKSFRIIQMPVAYNLALEWCRKSEKSRKCIIYEGCYYFDSVQVIKNKACKWDLEQLAKDP